MMTEEVETKPEVETYNLECGCDCEVRRHGKNKSQPADLVFQAIFQVACNGDTLREYLLGRGFIVTIQDSYFRNVLTSKVDKLNPNSWQTTFAEISKHLTLKDADNGTKDAGTVEFFVTDSEVYFVGRSGKVHVTGGPRAARQPAQDNNLINNMLVRLVNEVKSGQKTAEVAGLELDKVGLAPYRGILTTLLS